MATSLARKVLCSATLAACAWVGALSSAQAAIVPGRFDPDFGSTLSGVGYKGTAYFSIADSCLTTSTYGGGGGFIYSDYDCDGGTLSDAGMSLQSIHVDFYDTSNPSSILGTVDFGPSSTAVLGMFVTTSGGINTVVGVQTSLIGLAGGTPSTLPGNPAFYIQFGVLDPITGGSAAPGGPEDHLPGMPEAPEFPPDIDELLASDFQQVTMFKVAPADCTTTTSGVSGLCQSNPAALVVPEPGSVLLTMAALAACGWVGRRRED